MAILHMKAAAENPHFSPTEKLVLLCLGDHADDSGQCWPRVARIVEWTSLNKNTVHRTIAALERYGVIEVNRTPGAQSAYTLRVEALRAWGGSVENNTSIENDTSTQNNTGVVSKTTLGSVENNTTLKEEVLTPIEHPVNPQPAVAGESAPREKRKPRRAPEWVCPEWFIPLTELPGYKAGNHQAAADAVAEACGQQGVSPLDVVHSFAPYYITHRSEHNWRDPVQALSRTVDIQIRKYLRTAHGGRSNGHSPPLSGTGRRLLGVPSADDG